MEYLELTYKFKVPRPKHATEESDIVATVGLTDIIRSTFEQREMNNIKIEFLKEEVIKEE